MIESWKNDIYSKFSPILGAEKTEELIFSIEKVYSDTSKYEDALIIIDYLIDNTESIHEKHLLYLEEQEKSYNEHRITYFTKELLRLCITLITAIVLIKYNVSLFIYILLVFPSIIEIIGQIVNWRKR